MEFIGWIGSFLLTFCAVPLAWQSYKDGHSFGINMTYLHMWLWGEVFTLFYVLAQPDILVPLVANYAFNIVLIIVILYYKVYPRIIPETD